jgi:hypothetical protein
MLGVWECPKHDMYAAVVTKEAAAALERGDPYTMHDGQPGVVVRNVEKLCRDIVL